MAASRKPSPTKPEDAPQQPPTLETLKLLETDLYELVQKKIDLEKSLSQIEANIYAVEGAYLEDSLYGNIVRGYEGYANTRVARKGRPKDSDRIFSQSSVAYLKVYENNNRSIFNDNYSEEEDQYKPPIKRRRFDE